MLVCWARVFVFAILKLNPSSFVKEADAGRKFEETNLVIGVISYTQSHATTGFLNWQVGIVYMREILVGGLVRDCRVGLGEGLEM